MSTEIEQSRETIVNSIPNHAGDARVSIVLLQHEDGACEFVLRQETWSENVGWFAQNQIALAPEQVAGLRATLSASQIPVKPPTHTSSGNENSHRLRLVS